MTSALTPWADLQRIEADRLGGVRRVEDDDVLLAVLGDPLQDRVTRSPFGSSRTTPLPASMSSITIDANRFDLPTPVGPRT